MAATVREELDLSYNQIIVDYEDAIINNGRINAFLNSSFSVTSTSVDIKAEYEAAINQISAELDSVNALNGRVVGLRSEYIGINNDNSVTHEIDDLKTRNDNLRLLADSYQKQLDTLRKAKEMLDKENQAAAGGGGGGGNAKKEDTPYSDYTKDMAKASATKDKINFGAQTVQNLLGQYSIDGVGLLDGSYLAQGSASGGDINLPPIETTFMGITVLEELIANTTSQINDNVSKIADLNTKIAAAKAVPQFRGTGAYDKYGNEIFEPNEPQYSGAQKNISVWNEQIRTLEKENEELRIKQADNKKVLEKMRNVYTKQLSTETNKDRFNSARDLAAGISDFEQAEDYNGQGPCWVNKETGEVLSQEAYASRVSALDFFMSDIEYNGDLGVNEADFINWRAGIHKSASYLQFQLLGAINRGIASGIPGYDTSLLDVWYDDDCRNEMRGMYNPDKPEDTEFWDAMKHGELTNYKAGNWKDEDGDLGDFLTNRNDFQESYEAYILDDPEGTIPYDSSMGLNEEQLHEYYSQYASMAVGEANTTRGLLFDYDASQLANYNLSVPEGKDTTEILDAYNAMSPEKQLEFNNTGYGLFNEMYDLEVRSEDSFAKLGDKFGDLSDISSYVWSGVAGWRSKIDGSGLYGYEQQFLNQYGDLSKANPDMQIKIASPRYEGDIVFDGTGNVIVPGHEDSIDVPQLVIEVAGMQSNEANGKWFDLLDMQEATRSLFQGEIDVLNEQIDSGTLNEEQMAKARESIAKIQDRLNSFELFSNNSLLMLMYSADTYAERAQAMEASYLASKRQQKQDEAVQRERDAVDEKYALVSPEDRSILYLWEYYISAKRRAKEAVKEDSEYLAISDDLAEVNYDFQQQQLEERMGDLKDEQELLRQNIMQEELAKAREEHKDEINMATASTGAMVAFDKRMEEIAEEATKERLAKGSDELAARYNDIGTELDSLGQSDKERYNDARMSWQEEYDKIYLEEVKKAREAHSKDLAAATTSTGAMIAMERLIDEEATAAVEARLAKEGSPLLDAFSDIENEMATKRTELVFSYTDKDGNVRTLTGEDGNSLTYADMLDTFARKNPMWDAYSTEIAGIADVKIATKAVQGIETNSGAETTEYQNILIFTDKDGNEIENISNDVAALYLYQKGFDLPTLWKYGNNSTEWNEILDIYSSLSEAHIDASKIPTMMFFSNLFAEQKDANGNVIGFDYKINDYVKTMTDNLLDNARMFQGIDLAYDRINIYREISDNYLASTLYALTDGIFVDGLQQFAEGMKNMFGYTSTRTTAREYKNQYLNEFFANEYGNYYKVVYELGSVTGNMLPSILMSYAASGLIATELFGMTMSQVAATEGIKGALMQAICQSPGSILMYLSSAGNYKLEGLRAGLTLEEAERYGAISGLSEVLLERFLGGLPGVSNIDKVVAKTDSKLLQLGIRMFSEGNEEFWQDILAPYFMAMSRDGDSFLTGADHKKATVLDIAQEIDLEGALHSFAMGALSGGLMGGNIVSSSVNSITKSVYGVEFSTLFQQHLSAELANVENAKFTNPLRNPSAYTNALQNTLNDFQKLKSGELNDAINGIQEKIAADEGIQATFNKYNEGRNSSKVDFGTYLRDVSTMTALNSDAATNAATAGVDVSEVVEVAPTEQAKSDVDIKTANEIAEAKYQPFEPEEHKSLLQKAREFFTERSNANKVNNTVDAYSKIQEQITQYEEIQRNANNETVREKATAELEKLNSQKEQIRGRLEDNGIVVSEVEDLIKERNKYDGLIKETESKITDITNQIRRLNPNKDQVKINKLKIERNLQYTRLTSLYENSNVTEIKLDSKVNNKIDVRDIAGEYYRSDYVPTKETNVGDVRVGRYETLIQNISNLMHSLQTSNGLSASVVEQMRSKLDTLVGEANNVHNELVNNGVNINEQLMQGNTYGLLMQLTGMTTINGNTLEVSTDTVNNNTNTEEVITSEVKGNEEVESTTEAVEEVKNLVYGSINDGKVTYAYDSTNNSITLEGRTYSLEKIVDDTRSALMQGIDTVSGVSAHDLVEIISRITKTNTMPFSISRDMQGLISTVRNLKDGDMLFNYRGVLNGDRAIVIPSEMVSTYSRDVVIRITEDIRGITKNPVNSRTMQNFLLDLAKYDNSVFNYVNNSELTRMVLDINSKLPVRDVLDGLTKGNRKALIDRIYMENSDYFVNEIAPNLTKQEVSTYLTIDNIGYLSNANIAKIRESHSDIVDSILGNVDTLVKEVVRDTNNPLYNKLLNPEGNTDFFGTLTREEIISKINDYIIRNHDVLRNTVNANNYLKVPELRSLILNDNTMLEIVGNNVNQQMIDQMDDIEIYNRMKQFSSVREVVLYNQYMSAVLSGEKTVTRLNALDVIEYYMRDASFGDITVIEQVKKALVISNVANTMLGDNLLSIVGNNIVFRADMLDNVTADNMLSYVNCLEHLTSNGVDILGLMTQEQADMFNKVIPYVKNELVKVTNNTNGNVTVNQHAVANVMTATDPRSMSIKEELVSHVKDKYTGITRKQAEALLMTMEGIEDVNDGICNYADVASAIFEQYIRDINGQEKFEETFGFKMYVDGHLNEAELLTDMYLEVTGDRLVAKVGENAYMVSTTNKGYVHLTDVMESNATYRLDQIQRYLNSKGIHVDSETLRQTRIIDTINNKVDASQVTEVKSRIINEVANALNNGNHVSISAKAGLYMRNITTGNNAHVAEGHIMTVYGIDGQGRLLVEARVGGKVNKYSIDVETALKENAGITVDTLSMDLSNKTDVIDNVIPASDYIVPDGELAAGMVDRNGLFDRLRGNNQVQNQQVAISETEIRANQIRGIQSLMDGYLSEGTNTKLYSYYVRQGVTKFDTTKVRKQIERRYANTDNMFMMYWNPANPNSSFMNFTIGSERNYPFSNSYKIYVPVTPNTFDSSVITILDYLTQNNIASDNKIAPIARADAIVLRVYDQTEAIKVINFINSNANFPSNAQGIPLVMRCGKVSVAMDGQLSYNSVSTDMLNAYLHTTNTPTTDGFRDFVNRVVYEARQNGNLGPLRNIFESDWTDPSTTNMKRFDGDISQYYANVLEVVDLLKLSLNPNAGIVDYLRLCGNYQLNSTVDSQIQFVRNAMNNQVARPVQRVGNVNIRHNNAIEHAIRVMDAKYGNGSGINALVNYIATGNLNNVTRTEGAREMIASVPADYIRNYLQTRDVISSNTSRDMQAASQRVQAAPRANQVQSEYTKVLDYAIDVMNQKYGDGIARLQAYVNGYGANVLTSTGNVRSMVSQIPAEYIVQYLNSMNQGVARTHRNAIDAVIEDAGINYTERNGSVTEVDADGEYLTDSEVKENAGWRRFLNSLFGAPSKEQFTNAANQKTVLDSVPSNPEQLADIMIDSEKAEQTKIVDKDSQKTIEQNLDNTIMLSDVVDEVTGEDTIQEEVHSESAQDFSKSYNDALDELSRILDEFKRDDVSEVEKNAEVIAPDVVEGSTIQEEAHSEPVAPSIVVDTVKEVSETKTDDTVEEITDDVSEVEKNAEVTSSDVVEESTIQEEVHSEPVAPSNIVETVEDVSETKTEETKNSVSAEELLASIPSEYDCLKTFVKARGFEQFIDLIYKDGRIDFKKLSEIASNDIVNFSNWDEYNRQYTDFTRECLNNNLIKSGGDLFYLFEISSSTLIDMDEFSQINPEFYEIIKTCRGLNDDVRVKYIQYLDQYDGITYIPFKEFAKYGYKNGLLSLEDVLGGLPISDFVADGKEIFAEIDLRPSDLKSALLEKEYIPDLINFLLNKSETMSGLLSEYNELAENDIYLARLCLNVLARLDDFNGRTFEQALKYAYENGKMEGAALLELVDAYPEFAKNVFAGDKQVMSMIRTFEDYSKDYDHFEERNCYRSYLSRQEVAHYATVEEALASLFEDKKILVSDILRIRESNSELYDKVFSNDEVISNIVATYDELVKLDYSTIRYDKVKLADEYRDLLQGRGISYRNGEASYHYVSIADLIEYEYGHDFIKLRDVLELSKPYPQLLETDFAKESAIPDIAREQGKLPSSMQEEYVANIEILNKENGKSTYISAEEFIRNNYSLAKLNESSKGSIFSKVEKLRHLKHDNPDMFTKLFEDSQVVTDIVNDIENVPFDIREKYVRILFDEGKLEYVPIEEMLRDVMYPENTLEYLDSSDLKDLYLLRMVNSDLYNKVFKDSELLNKIFAECDKCYKPIDSDLDLTSSLSVYGYHRNLNIANNYLDKIGISRWNVANGRHIEFETLDQFVKGEDLEQILSLRAINAEVIDSIFDRQENPMLYKVFEIVDARDDDSQFISKFIEYLGKEVEKYAEIDDFILVRYSDLSQFTEMQLDNIANIMGRIMYSNSIEIKAIDDKLISILSTRENCEAYLDEIEAIFLRNNLPKFAKSYKVMELLYFDNTNNSNLINLMNIPSFRELAGISEDLSKIRDDYTLLDAAISKMENVVPEIKRIIFRDLLRTTFESNNRNAREYLESIKHGDELFSSIKTREQFDNLSDGDKQILDIYASHLDMLYQTLKGRSIVKENLSLYENLTRLNRVFTLNNKTNLPDMIVKAFASDAGFNTYQELEEFMNNSVREADQRNREFARKIQSGEIRTDEIIHRGDLVKSLYNKAVAPSILNDGIVAPELLLDLGSNVTPWDADFWRATRTLSIDCLRGLGYGDIRYVIPTSDSFITTSGTDFENSSSGSLHDASSYELIFGSGAGNSLVHYGVRTGIGSGHIGFFYANSKLDHDYSDVSYLKLQIARNGFYIPIFDSQTNKLAFTPEEYDMLRSRMNGLAYYGMGEYKPSSYLFENKSNIINGLFDLTKSKDTSLSKIGIVSEIVGNGRSQAVSTKTYSFTTDEALSMIVDGNYKSAGLTSELYNALRDGYLDDVIRQRIDSGIDTESEKLSLLLRISELDIARKRNAVNATISKVLSETAQEFGIDLGYKTAIDGDVVGGTIEVIDTGSTGRGSNLPGDGDFDLTLRVDGNLYSDVNFMRRFSQKLHDEFGRNSRGVYTSTSVNEYDIRDKNIKLDGIDDTLIDIDISFVQKTNRYDYSTDMALAERYDSMTTSQIRDLAVANVLYTKAMMKEAECYKPNRGDIPQGGLGGIGIENLVLQNGGSLTEAAMNFVEATRYITYSEYLKTHPNATFTEYMGDNAAKEYSRFINDYMLTDFGENHFAEKRASSLNTSSQNVASRYYPFDNFVTGNMSETGYGKTLKVLEDYIRRTDSMTDGNNMNNAINSASETTIAPFNQIAKDALMNWNGLSETEANQIVRTATYEQLESQVYATSSVTAAVNEIGRQLNLTEAELKTFTDCVFGRTNNQKFLSELGKRISSEDLPSVVVDIIDAVHKNWINDNEGVFFTKKQDRGQQYQYLPLEMIGIKEAKSDLLFIKPILESMGLKYNESEIEAELIRRITEAVSDIHTEDDLVRMIEKIEYTGHDEKIKDTLVDPTFIRETLIPELTEKGFIKDVPIDEEATYTNKRLFGDVGEKIRRMLEADERSKSSGISIRDTSSSFVTDLRYKTNTGGKLSLLDVTRMLDIKGDNYSNLRDSFIHNELTNNSTRLGISMDTVIEDIIQARANGIEITLPASVERVITAKNNLNKGDILLNTYDVYRGRDAFIRYADGRVLAGKRVLDIDTTFDDFVKNMDNKPSTKKLADVCDALKAYELLHGEGINISEDALNSMYDYMNEYFLVRGGVVEDSMLNFADAFTRYFARLNGVHVEVEFYNGEKADYGGQADGIVGLNRNFVGAKNTISYMDILNTIFHEVFHQIQSVETDSSKYSLGYAIERVLSDTDYAYYVGNYHTVFFEIDARYNAALMTLNYLENLSTEAYDMYSDKFISALTTEKANYEVNNNKYAMEDSKISRDAALESIIKNNPSLLDNNPVLKYIFNTDGTRKTLFELADVIKENSNNKNITNMINYWVRNSSYSLESITREYLEIYKNGIQTLPSEFQEVVNRSLKDKLTSLIEIELSNNDNIDIASTITEIVKAYKVESLQDGLTKEGFLDNMTKLVNEISSDMALTKEDIEFINFMASMRKKVRGDYSSYNFVDTERNDSVVEFASPDQNVMTQLVKFRNTEGRIDINDGEASGEIEIDRNPQQAIAGARTKFWCHCADGDVLFKITLADNYEDYGEILGAEFAKMIDLPCAEYDFATFNGERGVITKDIVGENEELIGGTELLDMVESFHIIPIQKTCLEYYRVGLQKSDGLAYVDDSSYVDKLVELYNGSVIKDGKIDEILYNNKADNYVTEAKQALEEYFAELARLYEYNFSTHEIMTPEEEKMRSEFDEYFRTRGFEISGWNKRKKVVVSNNLLDIWSLIDNYCILNGCSIANDQNIMMELVKMFTYDAILNQGDRHISNWSILLNKATNEIRFAPIYDNSKICGLGSRKSVILQKVHEITSFEKKKESMHQSKRERAIAIIESSLTGGAESKLMVDYDDNNPRVNKFDMMEKLISISDNNVRNLVIDIATKFNPDSINDVFNSLERKNGTTIPAEVKTIVAETIRLNVERILKLCEGEVRE